MEMANLDDKEEKWIKHYSSRHEILLVGEGDFSFAACLARSFGSAANMVATSLDSKEMLKRKYSGAMTNLEELKELGCTIIHGVDANTMSRHALLKSKLFDQIVFNFPHAGFLYREQDIFQIKLHQNLVQGFLRNASDMLTDRGEVHITHKTAHPFGEWKIEKLAKEVGLGLFREESFWLWDYPGYGNKRGDGDRCDYSFSVGQCSTFKFRKPSGLADQFSGMRISTE
ncbi:25S rRNA (uridine-N(3))-methyltransferase BMT5-like - like 1 [Theobroma cacao]|nr:25S rRNA (uridine-N(3))-methyltransferase BMT5-like - like 1 [Theobroma cacao]